MNHVTTGIPLTSIQDMSVRKRGGERDPDSDMKTGKMENGKVWTVDGIGQRPNYTLVVTKAVDIIDIRYYAGFGTQMVLVRINYLKTT